MKLFNKNRYLIKEITKEIGISFFFCAIFIFITTLIFGTKIEFVLNALDIITIKTTPNSSIEEIKLENNTLDTYPKYGSVYAKVKIPSINVDLNLFHGDTLDLLRNGLGHYSGSYFPGEGGTILIAGHNNKGILRELPNVNIDDEVTIETIYGNFKYKIYETKILTTEELNKIDINHNEEILVIYTCYPITIGHTNTRFTVYARRVS